MSDIENIRIKRNLTALVEFSRLINSSLDLTFILNNVLLTCMGKFFITKGLIALKIDNYIRLSSSKGISEEAIKSFPIIKISDDYLENKEFKKYINKNRITSVYKIDAAQGCMGILCIGERLNKQPLNDDDNEFLRTILNIAASAVHNSIMIDELKNVNRDLDKRIHRLNSLFELSKEFGMFSESARVARLLIYSVIGQFLVSKFAVVILEHRDIKILESKYDETELRQSIKKYNLNTINNPIAKVEIYEKYPSLINLGIELIVPMQMQNETRGLILLDKRITNQEFSETDIEFIYSIGSLAIISIENQRLFKQALEKQKLEEELEIARGIQKNLLPHSIPKFDKFEISAINISSQHVGGDYYDIIPLDENSYCIAIGDVSGKGVPAALLMANIQAFLRIICKHGMDISEATGVINDLITSNTSDGKFITFFWGMLNEKNMNFEYVNAGHNPPLLIRNKKIYKLERGGIILGVMKTILPYDSESIILEKDDVIILFTDGVTEAKNINDNEFSDERLEALCLNYSDLSSSDMVEKIKEEVRKFADGASQSDDITILIIKIH